MVDFDPKQIKIRKKNEVNELGIKKQIFVMENRSSCEIRSITVNLVYIRPSSGHVDLNSGSMSYTPAESDSQSLELSNIKPGETREFWFSRVSFSGWGLGSISGVLTDDRPFFRSIYNEQKNDALWICIVIPIGLILTAWLMM